jgi:hypothetical protein
MKKKEFLTEAKRKAIISEKEKAIIESFSKTFNKIKRTDERRINEDLTLQYADRPTASSPIVEIGYEDDGILHKFGFNFREDEEINLSDLFRGIETAKRGIQDAIEGASDLSSFDFQREIELVKKLSAFANQSKMDNNNVVMLKSNMNHPNQEWNDKEEKGMNDMWDLQNSQEDFDSYKYQGLSEEGIEGVNEQSVIPAEIFQMEEFERDDYDLIELNIGHDDSKMEMIFTHTYNETEDSCFYLKAIVSFYFNVSGSYRAASWGYDGGSPEEYPEEEFIPGDVLDIKYVDCQGEQEYQLTDEMKEIARPRVLEALEQLEEYISEQAWKEIESYGPDGD